MVEASEEEEEEDEFDVEDDGFVDFGADEDVISDEDADFEDEDAGGACWWLPCVLHVLRGVRGVRGVALTCM